MEAQKCKLCGARHHRYEPHQFPKDSADALDDPVQRSGPRHREARQADELPAPNDGGDATSPGHGGRTDELEAVKFDRNAYQREYMRHRRAKAKESK
jgi:hypothetical protein